MTAPTQVPIKNVKNPRTDNKDVEFLGEYESSSVEPVRLRFRLPVGLKDYVAELSWEEWEYLVAWMKCLRAYSAINKQS